MIIYRIVFLLSIKCVSPWDAFFIFKEVNNTRDTSERKTDSRIKGKDGGKHVKKDARRSMTVKLQKELAERTRNRDSGGSTNEALPDAQAMEQVEESAVNLAGGVREDNVQ